MPFLNEVKDIVQNRENWNNFAAGAVSGFFTRALVQPFDVLKIRFQLQLEPIVHNNPASKYKGLWHATQMIAAEEGIKSFWKGHIPAQFLSMSFGAVQFSQFHLFTNLHKTHFGPPDSQMKPLVDFVCGSIAGVNGTIASHPFDTIRTRLVGQGEPRLYVNMTQAFNHVIKTEGFLGLYKGLTANLFLIGPQAGAIFFSYNLCKRWMNWSEKSTFLQNFACGAISGTFGKSVVYPLDSVKKRLQVQGFEMARSKFGSIVKYRGLVDCFVSVIKYEGILGLYKGFTPSLLKAAFTTAAQFSFYEFFLTVINTHT